MGTSSTARSPQLGSNEGKIVPTTRLEATNIRPPIATSKMVGVGNRIPMQPRAREGWNTLDGRPASRASEQVNRVFMFIHGYPRGKEVCGVCSFSRRATGLTHKTDVIRGRQNLIVSACTKEMCSYTLRIPLGMVIHIARTNNS